MNVPPPQEPRTPGAPLPQAVALSDTILAAKAGLASQSQPTAAADPATASPSLGEQLRDLPTGIQGIWLGLVCITLLIGTAGALRSLFEDAPGPSQGRPLQTAAATPSGAPLASGSTSGAAPAIASTPGGALTIGAAGTGGPALGFGALAIRDRLTAHVRLRRIGPFLDDLEKLIDIDPTAIDRADVRKMIADTATYSMAPTLDGKITPEAQRLFVFLSERAGAAGPDILLDLVMTRGGSKAASYAEELLKSPELRAKGTPAFKIAYDLRVAPSCDARRALFERAKVDGDRRVLVPVFQMARCGKGPTDCCMTNDPAYKEIVRVINSKK